MAENLKKGCGGGGRGKEGLEEGGKLVGVLKMRGFGQAGVGGGIAETRGSSGGKSVVIGTEKSGWDGGGFHFGEDGGEGGGEAGAGEKREWGILVLEVEK